MRRIVVTIMLAFVCSMITTNAQNVVRKGNVFIEQTDSTKRSHAQKTKYIYQDKNGDKYTIYVSKSGKYFIVKKSKKSGKEYRKYLKDLKIE